MNHGTLLELAGTLSETEAEELRNAIRKSEDRSREELVSKLND
ncbi:hypothetical protein ACT4ML_18090 [Natrinema sp. LN54]